MNSKRSSCAQFLEYFLTIQQPLESTLREQDRSETLSICSMILMNS